jgi:hypothetical protein
MAVRNRRKITPGEGYGEDAAEYNQLVGGIDRRRVLSFVEALAQRQLAAAPFLAHALEVGTRAAALAGRFFAENTGHERRYHQRVCECAGFLHEARLDFEVLTELADEGVARTVAEATPDWRLPRPKRSILFANQVGLASADVQLIVLADIAATRAAFRRGGIERAAEALLWLETARQSLDSLHRLRNSGLRCDLTSEHQAFADLETYLRQLLTLARRQEEAAGEAADADTSAVQHPS